MKKNNNNNDTNRDSFGTPRNRSKTWDIKKNRDPKDDRRESKKSINKDEEDET